MSWLDLFVAIILGALSSLLLDSVYENLKRKAKSVLYVLMYILSLVHAYALAKDEYVLTVVSAINMIMIGVILFGRSNLAEEKRKLEEALKKAKSKYEAIEIIVEHEPKIKKEMEKRGLEFIVAMLIISAIDVILKGVRVK